MADTTSDTCGDVQKVCSFLHARGVKQDVIENFEYEKMGVEAITQASDNDLLLLGLDRRGDILSLRNFVQKFPEQSSKEDRRAEKMALLQDVLGSGKAKKTQAKQQQKGEKGVEKMRKVMLGWLHFDEGRKTYISVRMNKGGGTRDVDIKLNAGKEQIIDIAKSMFFSNGQSTFGPEEKMTFGLANYQQEDISQVKVSGMSLSFTLQRYIEKCKMARVRLYLTSKINKLDDIQHSSTPADQNPAESDSNPDTMECGSNSDDGKIKSLPLSDLHERRKLIAQQDAAYEESLLADRAKSRKLMEEIQHVERQSKLQQARLLRTPQEPKENEKSTSVVIQVRHVSLGILRRNFYEWERMTSVYDWVGSLSLIPEHFQLLDYAGKLLLPLQPLTELNNTTLYMSEAMTTPALDDEEVTFLGFGGNSLVPAADHAVQPIGESPPEQLLECDESITSKSGEQHPQRQPTKKKKKFSGERTKDRGRLFRQCYLPVLVTDQTPTGELTAEHGHAHESVSESSYDHEESANKSGNFQESANRNGSGNDDKGNDDEESEIPMDNAHFNNRYASLLYDTRDTSNSRDASFSDSDISVEEDTADDMQNSHADQHKDITEIASELAKAINASSISKFNISRNFLWEGTKRALSRKTFSPANKMSVKFTDDAGVSEGAVDLGGPMREFFTLALEYLHDSQLFCGRENSKFLSFNHKCLADKDYHAAGTIIAMSFVHGGPGPKFLSPVMFEALVSDPSTLVVGVQDVYDSELQLSLQTLLNSASPKEAMQHSNEGILPTILDLAGTLAPIKSMEKVLEIVDSTTRWFVLGRAQPALESFKKGLSILGVLDAIKAHPASFRPIFCDEPGEEMTSEVMENLFTPKTSPIGSTKAIKESLVLSRWRDYLQDGEEDEPSIALSDILFFATGCKVVPPRKFSPSIEFLHESESRFPTANTCSATLRLPVVHTTYESFKDDMSFGLLNGRGFGNA